MTTKKKANSELPSLSRRRYLKLAGAGAGAATFGHYADPVEDADAIGFATAAVAVTASAATGYVAGRLASGSGKDAEEAAQDSAQDVNEELLYEAVTSRMEFNETAVLDTQSFLGDQGLGTMRGLYRLAYEDGQAAAIDAINNGKQQADVAAAARTAANQRLVPLQETIIKQWNTSAEEMISYNNDVGDQTLVLKASDRTGYVPSWLISLNSTNVTLMDGSTLTLKQIGKDAENEIAWYGPTGRNTTDYKFTKTRVNYNGTHDYLLYSEWSGIWNRINSLQTDLHNELDLWVNNVYGNVQSGALSTDDLFTPQQFANNSAENEQMPNAVSDLIALNANVDLDRATKIQVTDDAGIKWTATGMLAATEAPSGGFEVGQSYQPNSTDADGNTLIGSVYIAHRRDSASGVWTDYQTSIDGGVVVFTTQPKTGYVYSVTTSYGETVTLQKGDFTDNGDGTYSADVSDQLENSIAEVTESAIYYSEENPEWIQSQISNTFTVVDITDESTGESVNQINMDQPQTNSPDTYQTAKDFEDAAKRRQELYERMLERFEEVEGGGGGGLFGGIGSLGSNMKRYILYGGGALAALAGASFAKDFAE